MSTSDSRVEAAKQWNNTACGELEGDKNKIEYFHSVERDRYAQQLWQQNYFQFATFRGKKILEIGVGQGTDLIQFARAGAVCSGVDITDNHLLLTRKNFALQGFKVELIKADATRLPFPDESFDVVYSFGVIHHIPEAGLVLDEIFRVLKPGGKVMLALYHKWSAFHVFKKIIFHGLGYGWLFKKGYAGTLATIEHGADGVDIKPYVKLYSKAETKKLLKKFELEDISVHQLHRHHFYPVFLEKFLSPILKSSSPIFRANISPLFAKYLESILGWYVTAIGRKGRKS
jgi:ubiquinone/menaquinone biosynthesis C-methylase UbiE